jgi:putative two-component system response regulator
MSDTRPRLLLVDDDPINLRLLRHQLQNDYRLAFAKSGARALELAQQHVPDLVLLDVTMPGLGGYDTCKALKAQTETASVPVLFVTAPGETADEAAGFAAGGVDFIARPCAASLMRSRILTHLSLRRVDELRSTHRQVVQCLGLAAEYKDNESGLHVIRMSHYARILGEALEWSAAEVEDLFSAAPLHDVGKIGIPDAILQKPAALSAEEITVMQQHAEIGARIIGQHHHGMLAMAARIALSHHEKWNGTGYPLRLKGEAIPIEARIVALADVFDALTSDRPYKKAWAVDDAVAFVKREAGAHFDPGLVSLFVQHLPKILDVKAHWADEPSGAKGPIKTP